MANEIDQQGHVFVIREDYYYRMVNDHIQKHRAKHRETTIEVYRIIIEHRAFIHLPKHRLSRENMEDFERVPVLHI